MRARWLHMWRCVVAEAWATHIPGFGGRFTIEVDGHSTLGVCTVDLLTLATGPNEFRLPYIHHRP